jgi:hypothetical protein
LEIERSPFGLLRDFADQPYSLEQQFLSFGQMFKIQLNNSVLQYIIVAVILGLIFGASPSQAQQVRKPPILSIDGEGSATIFYQSPGFTLTNMPLVYRNISSHPDDRVPNTHEGPVPKEDVSIPAKWAEVFTGRIGGAMRLGLVHLVAGGYISFTDVFDSGITFGEDPSNPHDAIRRRNYQGTYCIQWVQTDNQGSKACVKHESTVGTERRDQGTALTYYRLQDDGGGRWNYGFYMRLSLVKLINETNQVSLYAEYSEGSDYVLRGENGWDRFGNLEAQSIFDVAHIAPRRTSAGIELTNREGVTLRAFVGLSKPRIKAIEPWHREDFITNSKPCIGVTVAVHLPR